ncbi:hypothetical protein KI387_035837 [Taxus chinensis]|uniref:NAC domain-containing protein n=1 Tax=Taxus chinensis TaxID=29808 RepID=A0AA38KPF7_TAXCH|nr:hypothetical protein KI387_035837 [Taxus chinensis]
MRQLRMEEQHLPGFRFHPTEEELVGFYLRRKVDKKPFKFNVIQELDLYAYEPWDLPGLSFNGEEKEREWFFFVKPRGHNDGRPNRITPEGFWKATGTDKPVYCHSTSKLIGLRKTMVFYRGRAIKSQKTDWIMNEYRLHDSGGNESGNIRLCRVYRKAISVRPLNHRTTTKVNDETELSSSSVITGEQSFGESKKRRLKVETGNLTRVNSLERWWCFDGGSSDALAFLWD